MLSSDGLKSAEEEYKMCISAFKGVATGVLVWCCHHEIEIEFLYEMPKRRISYIAENKPLHERARRFHEFRPVKHVFTSDAFAALVAVKAACEKSWEKVTAMEDAARSPRVGVLPETLERAEEEIREARRDRDALDDSYYSLCKLWLAADAEEIRQAHQEEVPDTAWNGFSIF